MIAGIIRF